jgi:two-component system, chemotaxis family, sensor kinase CheA
MGDDIVQEFLIESNENLDLLDRELVALEKNPGNRDTLASVFRTIHTIKGTCGFLGFTKLESVAHVGENLLSKLRDGAVLLTPEIATVLLQMVDAIRQMLQAIDTSGNEGERDDQELINTLTKFQQEPLPISGHGSPKVGGPSDGSLATQNAGKERKAADSAASGRERKVSGGDPAKAETAKDAGHVVAPAEHAAKRAGTTNGDLATKQVHSETHEPVPQEAAELQPPATRGGASEASIRVDVGLLDKLMTLVGELVLARNQILQFTNTTEDTTLVAPSQRLNLITTELQEGVMKTRMQPIGNVWSKFPRTVRDVAAACGKQIRIEMEGKETELDKTIIEAIKDPLTHIVRNSADHGIELPERRIAAGKPAEGKLLLRAFHEGGQVIIEITDDGAGLPAEKIRKKALERGLITAEQAARMGEREVVNLIFLPGFSTAEKVTNVSGRGVGMDVVKTNIEKIGGTVDVQSQIGVGTTVRMKIPLTLAIIPALIVTTSGDRYAIPQISLLELVRVEGEDARKSIELIQGVPVYRLRGRLLPLVYLNRELGLERATESTEARDASAVNIVVLQADGHPFGLAVDEVNDTEEIVVKPLGKQLKGLKVFAGSTIMGDGRVALILDVLGIAQASNVVNEVRNRALAEKEAELAAADSHKQTLLLFTGPDDGHMAVPLDHVGRLEEFLRTSVERAGGIEVVQYRGEILPLMFLSEMLEERRRRRRAHVLEKDGREHLQGIVYSGEGKRVGIVIERILDIVHEELKVKSPPTRFGVLCTTVIGGRVTELLDMPALLHAFERKSAPPAERERVEV